MIDIHCHIIPGIDDGVKTMQEALELAKLAKSEGIDRIIATPHHQDGRHINTKREILSHVADLNDALRSNKIDVTILPGQETRLYGAILDGLEGEEILTLNNGGKYFFVELPFDHVPRYTSQVLYDVQLQGYVPIIVHPERNQELMERPEKLYRFVKNGALTQITAASIVGQFGSKVKKFTNEIIQANLTHFLASDAHNLRNRVFYMQAAIDYCSKKYGTHYIYQWIENSELIANSSHPIVEIPQQVKRNKLFGFLTAK